MGSDTAVAHHVEDSNAVWDGGKSPMKSSYGKLMMWYFLLSDAFTFAGFLIAYGTLRVSMPTWPVPDFVFQSLPGGIHNAPLIFVTIMTFVLLFSSFTMVRAVQEGKRENKRGVVIWMILTIIGGAAFLGCQAWEWTTLIKGEHMSVTTNPFGTHTAAGAYLNKDGTVSNETFEAGESYLMHMAHADDHGHGDDHADDHGGDHADDGHHEEGHADSYGVYNLEKSKDYPFATVDERGYIHRKFKVTEGDEDGMVKTEQFGPKAFGALFFFITGFHGFHVLSGVIFLIIIMLNVASGLYEKRKNEYEMVEKMGLYWHFVDLVWIFVFLVFYLI